MSYLKIKLFADGADFDGMMTMYAKPEISGFTTNPTLMRKAGITDYAGFARQVLRAIPDRPVSFEVFANDLPTMEKQAHVIAAWGHNANVKIPVTNTEGVSTAPLIATLSKAGIVLNITAITTVGQVEAVAAALVPDTAAIISVFAGRVADTGIDPVPLMKSCLSALSHRPKAELLWASSRELLNIFQANDAGCHIITASNDILDKLKLVGKDLLTYSRETVKMFHDDAKSSGFEIAV